MNALLHPERARLAESVRRACPEMALNLSQLRQPWRPQIPQATLRRSRYGMRIYRDPCDLSGRELVSALHLERGGADLDPQTASQRQEID
jgi:hypothetical protein